MKKVIDILEDIDIVLSMTIKKITPGFVIQEFNTETKQFESQEFIAGEEIDYEDENGVPLPNGEFEREYGEDLYLSFAMVQPDLKKNIEELINLAEKVIQSSKSIDTVVSKESLNQLEDWIVNHCGEGDIEI